MDLLTIFTPTYNRGYILPKLYESLKRQSYQNFEWIVVDDGSTDDTSTLVTEWQQEGFVNIIFMRQENQGKHIAINSGMAVASGDLFFIVDSDDYLTNDAVEKIFVFWERQNITESISGIISYRKYFDERLVGTRIPPHIDRCKLRETYKKYGSIGDKVVIYKTDILKQYPFPKFDSERFLGESYVYNQIDDNYDMLIFNDEIYYFDYQIDGLSQDFRKLYRANPLGFQAAFELQLKNCYSFVDKMKTSAHIVCLSIKNRKFKGLMKLFQSFASILGFPFGLAFYFYIFILKVSDVKPFVGSSDKS